MTALLIENNKLMHVVAEQRSAAKAFCQKLHVTLNGLAMVWNSEFLPPVQLLIKNLKLKVRKKEPQRTFSQKR